MTQLYPRGFCEGAFSELLLLLLWQVSVHLPMNHPNIIRLLDVYELEDCVMMVIERAEGRDLQSFINIRASPKFSEAVTRVLFQQLFDAMDYIHNTQRVIHCDMKPENILFGRDLLGDTVQSLGLFNRAKICDFGNARPARDAKYGFPAFRGLPKLSFGHTDPLWLLMCLQVLQPNPQRFIGAILRSNWHHWLHRTRDFVATNV